ncbi:MAG TPA: CsgG/HfaB family protein, partial [Candidatus Hydrogenedentes bacterium]|nr:CsgG/HfaB family protein [Candidatus Hydrogenedentota bacterium]
MFKRLAALVFLGIVAAGCATESRAYRERDGVRYGVTHGVFRGRWWSYYERGASYLAGQFYEEARSDFETALQGYTRDTWRARTYGLHFVEYFPNRELGVLHYHAGELDQAEQYLRRSLASVDTERAHYYLDLVTRARIQSGAVSDATAPAVQVDTPLGVLVAAREVPVEIRARDDVGVNCVWVDGKVLYQRGSPEELAFSEELLLPEGPQTIRFEALDLADKKVSQEVEVTVDLTGPTVGIFSPTDALVIDAASIEVQGAAVDRYGVASVTINGQTVAESGGPTRLEFQGEAALSTGENTVVIAARDLAGNETRTALRIYRGQPQSPAARLWRLERTRPDALRVAHGGAGALQVVLSATTDETPGISLKSPDPDRPYRHNRTLRVAGDVVTETKVASLTINGEPFTDLTGAPHESFNRRIPIDAPEDETGATTVPLSIVARDETGATVSRDFQVEVRPVMLKSRESRMPVAVLAFAGNGVEPALAELLRVSTEGELVNGDRFRVVDRTRLQDVLTEQQLSAALGDPNQAIQLGKLTPAHVFLVADVFPRDQQGIEVKARVISTETSDVVATLDTFIDNRDDRAKVTAGCAAIVSQLAALFPRLSGELLAVRGQDAGAEVLVNWTPEDGVRPGAYMLVVREEEPWVDEDT